MTTVAIIQPSYLPWKGFFSQVLAADHFVFLDNVQYDKRGWRNRNRIRTPGGPKWITIPVHAAGSHDGLLIQNVEIVDDSWAIKHRDMVRHAYSKAPHYDEWEPLLSGFFGDLGSSTSISEVARESVVRFAEALDLGTEFHLASEILASTPIDDATQRLVEIAKRLDASVYLSGPAAKDYLDVRAFGDRGMKVAWMGYDFPEYLALHGGADDTFDHGFSLIDLLFAIPGGQVRAHLECGVMTLDESHV